MLSKDTNTLKDILSLVGKNVPAKVLEKQSQSNLDAAENWAVRRNADKNGLKTHVPSMPDWLFKY